MTFTLCPQDSQGPNSTALNHKVHPSSIGSIVLSRNGTQTWEIHGNPPLRFFPYIPIYSKSRLKAHVLWGFPSHVSWPFRAIPRPIPRPVAPHGPAASAASPREHRRRRFSAAGTARSPAMLMVFPSGKYVYIYIYNIYIYYIHILYIDIRVYIYIRINLLL